MLRLVALLCLIALPLRAENIVAGLSQNRVTITTDFTGSDILIYGAVKRETAAPKDAPMQVIITVEGPSTRVMVRRKEHRYGVWMNTEAVPISSAPSFYAIASSGPLDEVLSQTDDLRYSISVPRAINTIGVASSTADAPQFLEALVRLREADGLYLQGQSDVDMIEETLFRTDVRLPANLIEGQYRVRMFITRGGVVVDTHEELISVTKDGLERWLYNLAHEQPLIYGFLALLIAVVAGWGASAGFALLRR